MPGQYSPAANEARPPPGGGTGRINTEECMPTTHQTLRQLHNQNEQAKGLRAVATLALVKSGRATLRFADGQLSRKAYLLCGGYTYRAGQRVMIAKHSGTWLVEYPL